jgi:glycosyltransferase involved in cell wall biosynthesis
MRVLHLLASPWFTGPAEAVVQLALAQRALGLEVTVACDRKRPGDGAEEPLVPRLEGLGLLAEVGLELSVKSSPLAVLRDVRAMKKLQVEVLHSHFSHDHTVARLGLPRGARLVRSIHAPRSLRATTPRAHAWTVPTEALARRLIGQKVLVLPALLDVAFQPPSDRAVLRRQLGLPEGPLVGMVSTFQSSRRHAVGLEAFRLLRARQPHAHLLLVGDGALEKELKASVKTAGLNEVVTFTGYRSGADFVRTLQALDEVWVLGLGNDYSARAAAQARAAGARVVAVDEGALARYADVLVEPLPARVAEAALGADRSTARLESPREIAERLAALYLRLVS